MTANPCVRGLCGLSVTLFVLALMGCATPAHQRVLKINEGMDKTQVLDVAGNPKRTQRKDGGDLWTYVYYIGDQHFERDVRFEGGHVVSVSMPREVPSAEMGQKVTRDYENLVKDAEAKAQKPPAKTKEFPSEPND